MRVTTFGEIMLRLKSPGQERLFQSPRLEASFGGSEANVAVALARLGMPARFLSVLPDNQVGRECLRQLRGQGVDLDFVRSKPGRMGLYFFENGANQRPSNVVYDRDGSALAEMASGDIDWTAAFRDQDWFHLSGITPALSRACADAALEAVKAARKAGLKISLDLNYRAKLWNYGAMAKEVMGELAAYADLLIGNEEDYQKSLGVEGPKDPGAGKLDPKEYEAMCGRALAAFPKASRAAVTLRESRSADSNDWSAMLASRRGCIVSRKYHMDDIVDRVGAGDSFSAGLIYGIGSCGTDAEALEFAVALSCLKHTIPGDFALVELGEVKKLLEGGATGRVQR